MCVRSYRRPNRGRDVHHGSWPRPQFGAQTLYTHKAKKHYDKFWAPRDFFDTRLLPGGNKLPAFL